MDIGDEDVIHLWQLLHKHQVSYIMIGGFAVALSGYPRYTGDCDIWLKDTPENKRMLNEVFREMEMAVLENIEEMQFVPGWTCFYLPGGMTLDLMTSLKGLDASRFDECFQIAEVAEICGVPVRFLHLNHLLEAKRAAGRPKDLLDVEELEKLYRLK